MVLLGNFFLKNIRRKKCVKITLHFGFLYFIYHLLLSTKGAQDKLLPVNLTYVVVHLDLKRTPLKLEYLKSLLPTLKEYGVTGLLMEYEDMFPFEGRLANLSNINCYDTEKLKEFLIVAQKSGLEIIPLVQTFGHMQYVLKLREFEHLREDPKFSDSICPSKDESLALIKDMIEQMINFHTSIAPLKHIHIGCDEVYHMKKCADCVKRNLPKQWIYLNHVTKVTAFVKILSQQTKVLVWDDMLRSISPINWQYDYKVPIEPVYWDYVPNINVSHASLLKYHKTFSDIWIATAFKGADGNSSLLPNAKNRFLNHYNWLNIIRNYKFGGEKTTYNFKGIILTGWSRYHHLAPSCDLLPASIPSLILNLLLIKEFKEESINSVIPLKTKELYKYFETKLNYALRCDKVYIDFDETMSSEMDHLDRLDLYSCRFEGSTLYETLKMYERLNLEIVANAKMHPRRLNNKIKKECDESVMSIQFLESELAQNMREYFEENFITEYIFDKMYKLRVGLSYCLDYSKNNN